MGWDFPRVLFMADPLSSNISSEPEVVPELLPKSSAFAVFREVGTGIG